MIRLLRPTRRSMVVPLLGLLLGMAMAVGADQQGRFPWFEKQAPARTVAPVLIAAEEAARALEEPGTIVVDLRERPAFVEGHVAGARWLGPGVWPRDLKALCAFLGAVGLPADATVVLVDAQGEPTVLARPFFDLVRSGQASVRVLAGGMASWTEEEVTGEPEPHTSVERACAAGDATTSSEELARQVGLAGIEILDLRAGWGDGYTAPVEFGRGHIPHALPFELGPEPLGLGSASLEALRRRVLALGPRQGERVRRGARFVVYDEGTEDGRDVLAFLLLRSCGFDAVTLERGWQGWQADGAPIVRILEATELADWLQEAGRPAERPLLIDLREDWDHRAGHLPGALSLPERRVASELVDLVVAQRPGQELAEVPLVFYCYGRDCIRSREAASQAARLGSRRLYWFREGVEGWQAAGYELEEASPPPGP